MKKVLLLTISILILCFMGCQAAQEPESDTAEISEPSSSPAVINFELSEKTVDIFAFKYEDTYTTLEEFECEYNEDGISVYSKYISNGMGIGSGSDFPYFHYVLYIVTPSKTYQQFPVQDYFINQDTKSLYIIFEDSDFESLKKVTLQKAQKFDDMDELLGSESLDKMIKNAHQLSDNEEDFSGLHFEFVETESENTFICEASGIDKGTGKKYYIDIEWDETTDEGIVAPCILRTYDVQKDAEEFEKCQEAFDMIKQGDWSMVVPHKNVKDDWDQYKLGYAAENPVATDEQSLYENDWLQVDVNNDGMPELICQNGNGDRTEHKKPIDLIFAWHDDHVELVYIDFIDAMEFLFLSDAGNLIYESSILGGPQISVFTKYYFDEKWNCTFEESLSLIYFLDENVYDEEEMESLKKSYPDTFGRYGSGLHSQHFLADQTQEYLTQNEFINAYRNMTGQEFLEDNALYWEERFKESLTEEKFYDYDIKTDGNGNQYVAINGFQEKYKDNFKENLRRLTKSSWSICFPETLDGIPVKEISAYAFQNINLGSYSDQLEISANIVFIGEHCFENCGLSNVTFERKSIEDDDLSLSIGDRAFAGNQDLWGVYLNNTGTDFGSEVFADCAEKLYVCYLSKSSEADNHLKQYAQENHFEAVEIPLYISETPIVNYPETPYLLTPDVRNFFYGDSTDDDEKFCSFEYADDALDFGFPEWMLPCGEFCAMQELKYDITATSELPSADERYAAKNLDGASFNGYIYSPREAVWAEGAEGYGIGESISITQCCSYRENWDGDGTVYFYEGDIDPDIRDGYMRYTEICIVNGYARNEKTWEENGRVKRLLMYVEDQPYAYLELEDTIRPQYFTLPINDIKAADGVDIHFKFVIEEVYPGTKYEDTCLTGLLVELMGRRGH